MDDLEKQSAEFKKKSDLKERICIRFRFNIQKQRSEFFNEL